MAFSVESEWDVEVLVGPAAVSQPQTGLCLFFSHADIPLTPCMQQKGRSVTVTLPPCILVDPVWLRSTTVGGDRFGTGPVGACPSFAFLCF